jgi:hypothetical protein
MFGYVKIRGKHQKRKAAILVNYTHEIEPPRSPNGIFLTMTILDAGGIATESLSCIMTFDETSELAAKLLLRIGEQLHNQ